MALLLTAPGWAPTAGAQALDGEKLVKVQSAFLLNFLKLVQWPTPADPAGGEAIGVEFLFVNAPAVAEAFEATLRGRPLQGLRFEVASVSFPEEPPTPDSAAAVLDRLGRAGVVYFGGIREDWRQVVTDGFTQDAERQRERLVITRDRWGVDTRSSHLSFEVRNGRVVFLTSESALRASPLSLSSKLLALADRRP